MGDEDLERRRRARAREAATDAAEAARARRRSDGADARAFVLATSPLGFLGDGTFCYSLALVGGLAVAGTIFFGHRALASLPDLAAVLSNEAIGVAIGAPSLLGLACFLCVPAWLRRTTAARLVRRSSACFPVEGLPGAIGGAWGHWDDELRVRVYFAAARPPVDEVLARARDVHPGARVEADEDCVVVRLPRGNSRLGRALARDTSDIPGYVARRLLVGVWRDALDAVLLPLHASTPIARVSLAR